MSLWPRSFIHQEPSFTPLFRLLDEFDTHYSRGNNAQSKSASLKASFTPKFDVKENNTSYELHGELPGIEQKDVEIEFTDANTLTIRGHTEHSYESGTRPTGFLEGSTTAGAITEGDQTHHKTAPHQPTVEDEEGASKSTAAPTSTEVATKEEPTKDKEQPETKYWVTERSIGDFSRSFSFPVRVDQDAVTASMKNGILSVVVPKAKKHESRKITIN
jgi:HSP20 family protein